MWYQTRSGLTAIFTCNSGFVLHGSNVSHCQTDGHWSAPIPACIAAAPSCSTPEMESIILTPEKSHPLGCSTETSTDTGQLLWIRSGNAISNQIMKNGTLFVIPDEVGLYICLVQSHKHVNIVRAVNVVSYDIHESKTKDIPVCDLSFKDKRTNITVKLGAPFSVSCEVNSVRSHTTWFKGDEPVLLNSSHRVTDSHLNFQNFGLKDEGTYTCTVRRIDTNDCFISKSVQVVADLSAEKEDANNDYECGRPVDDTEHRTKRVIDGNRASPHSAPWMCMLSTERNPAFCGCSLIDELWVVTAAHCFYSSSEEEPLRLMTQDEVKRIVKIKFGKQQRRLMERGEVVRNVQSLVVHPSFKPKRHDEQVANEHDITLVKLDQKIIFQGNIRPICLPPRNFLHGMSAGTLGVVTGWGRVSVRGSVMAVYLQEASLPLVNINLCQDSTSYVITDNMLCAGYAESYRPDTCFGDSGGPFTIKTNERWFLVGIVSWGEGCSTPRKFGIYTKVENYVPWISSVIKKTE